LRESFAASFDAPLDSTSRPPSQRNDAEPTRLGRNHKFLFFDGAESPTHRRQTSRTNETPFRATDRSSRFTPSFFVADEKTIFSLIIFLPENLGGQG
jgi:hypothetical protein